MITAAVTPTPVQTVPSVVKYHPTSWLAAQEMPEDEEEETELTLQLISSDNIAKRGGAQFL